MTPWLPRSTVAVEDKRFYQHGGVDYVGILRALWADVSAGKVVEGGSTISQQLVRNMYTGREQTFDRKIKEACLAIKLSDKWSKSRILQTYLNTVYYGNHAYGVEAAAETYFSKKAKDLTLPQAALLAGLPQAPSVYDPLHNPTAALVRRKEVLQALLAESKITAQQYHWAVHQKLHLKPGSIYQSIKQPYFFSYVIDELESVYGANTVREGGLRVYTTIEPKLQYDANAAIHQTLNEPNDPAAAIVSVVPGTGRDHDDDRRDPGEQAQRVQPHVAVGPAGGLDVQDVRARFGDREGDRSRLDLLHLGALHVHDRAPGAWTTTRPASPGRCTPTATPTPARSRSRARPCARTTRSTRSSRSTSAPTTSGGWRRRLGVHLTQKPVASIGLGSLSVSPLDMAAAYATFADGGIYAKPTAIRKVILPNGRVDKTSGWGVPQTKRVLSQGVAWKVTQVLGENALYGTGYGSYDGVHPNAGKTGHDERPRRRLVRRVHPRLLDRRLDGLSAR